MPDGPPGADQQRAGAEATLPQAEYRPGAPGTLGGLRVLDLSRLVAGNVLTQHLADYGADVVKVEPEDGDTLRHWRVDGVETSWKVYGRGKRSLCLNFRHAAAIETIRRLVPGTAIFIESFRPGTLEAMGLGPEALLALEPKLVIIRISGWGQDGPYSRRPGFGTLIEGFSGFASMNGFADRAPVLPPMYLADVTAGLSGTFAALAALREVEVNGGQGQVIDLPLLDPLYNLLGPQAANFRLTGRPKPRSGSRGSGSSPRNVYRAADGEWVCLSASTRAMAERLIRAIGGQALLDDPRFASPAARAANMDALDGLIADFVAARSQAETVAFFEQAEVTIGPVYGIEGFLRDPHVQARGLVADYPDRDMGRFPMQAIPTRFSGTPGAIRSPAPRLGEHSRAILAEAGFLPAEIEDGIATGLTRTAP
ncbi:CaiB/BaiF CoA-transferase family protein [Roseomonas sp. 18066]|uniref:CaiB/BaiF CoA transferase family protein n=1 Tax=Roseomonas sp. 18066 TaxID=2681412 RepID=UPI00135AAE7C|nr:CoA transferase [Roseomonas sp. 18066]